jgi:hypothetical protein
MANFEGGDSAPPSEAEPLRRKGIAPNQYVEHVLGDEVMQLRRDMLYPPLFSFLRRGLHEGQRVTYL